MGQMALRVDAAVDRASERLQPWQESVDRTKRELYTFIDFHRFSYVRVVLT